MTVQKKAGKHENKWR